MKWWKKMTEKVLEPEKSKRLQKWQTKYESAKSKYNDALSAMQRRDMYYDGDRFTEKNPNSNQPATKKAINVRNIIFELIESEVEISVPMPKVIPMHEEDKAQAKVVEEFLKNEIELLNLTVLNDLQERTTPIQGGSFSLVDWDNTKGYHCSVGDLSIEDIHPRQFIPQPGVLDIEQMDYFFVLTPATREYIKRRFDKDVEDENTTNENKLVCSDPTAEDVVTIVTCFYKNEKGGVGRYRWCGDVELEDLEDYQARHLKVCAKCGKVKEGDVCECGSKKFVDKADENTVIDIEHIEQVETMSGEIVEKVVVEQIEIPFYKPDCYPVVLRKNISKDRQFLGLSDVDVIADQQDTIKKLGSKINEKLLKGGSFVTLPDGVGVETTDNEMKVIRVKTPAEKQLIDVITCQASTAQDMQALEQNYSWAKSALGISDAFQGKYDSSALSGTAKQYSINQVAGRLESKRVLKQQAYADLYEKMFKFALAYSDAPIPINIAGTDGEVSFSHFDKRDFLKQDAEGTFYWNDEFIFEVDPTSTLLTNREAMWNQNDLKLQSGAYGPIGDLETNYLYWLQQERSGYPNAGEVKRAIEERLQRQKEQIAQMQMQAQGEIPNEM